MLVFLIPHATYWRANMPPLARQEATIVRKWLCSLQEPTAALSVFSTASLSPACPSSPLLFTHRQLSQFPNAVIPSNILCSCFLLFSCNLGSLPLSCGFVSRVRRSRLGAEQREEEKWGRGGYICSFMTNHMCFWVFVFTCFSWKRGWWKGMTGEERQAYGSCLLS